jgi:hypothetical protein
VGREVKLAYPIGFFEISAPDRQRAGLWAFFGKLTGHPYIGSLERMRSFSLCEKEFLSLDSFSVRPLNREIYTTWKWLKLAIDAGKPISWVKSMAKSYAPPSARRWLARE